MKKNTDLLKDLNYEILNNFLKRNNLSNNDIIKRRQPSEIQDYYLLSNGLTLEITEDKTGVILSDLLKENPHSGYSKIIDIGISNIVNSLEPNSYFILQETKKTNDEDEENHRIRIEKIETFFENRKAEQDFFWTLSQPKLNFNDIKDLQLKEDLIRIYHLSRYFVSLDNIINENINYDSLILIDGIFHLRSPALIFADFNPTTGKARKDTRENFSKDIINEKKWNNLSKKYHI